MQLDEILGATVHLAATDARAEREALVEEVVADLRGRVGGPPSSASAVPGSLGSIGQVLAPSSFSTAAAAAVSCRTTLSCRRRPAGPRPACSSDFGRPVPRRWSTGSLSTPAEELRPKSLGLVAALGSVDGLARVPDSEILLDGAQLGDGYGRRTEAADEATRLLARSEGILVDPIYTAKALAGLIALARVGRLDGRRVVFWHAGGTPGLFEPLGD